MKKNKTTFILILFFFIGLAILFYPTLSDYTNKKLQSRAITSYEDLLKDIEEVDYEKYFNEGIHYNEQLKGLDYPLVDYKKVKGYEKIFNVDGDGMMGYITIPKIGVELPIYHGTSSHVLNTAVGHLEGSSFPTGTIGTHAVFSAHTGLPSAKLFTSLDKLEIGDNFTIKVYDKSLSYEVDQILIVKPNETDALKIEQDKDYVTLMTCTPYGLNTHRLLVRGHRVKNVRPVTYISTEAFKVDKLLVCIGITLPLLVLWMIAVAFTPANKHIDYESIFVYPNAKRKEKIK